MPKKPLTHTTHGYCIKVDGRLIPRSFAPKMHDVRWRANKIKDWKIMRIVRVVISLYEIRGE